MSLRVYNTLTRTKEVFTPVVPGKVGIYLCGPTVYKSPHIGHMVGPVIFDAIKRYLTFKGYKVTWIINITDVEDKLIEVSHKTGRSVQELAEHYTKEYLDCLSDLGVDGVDQFPRASDHIPEIIKICQALIQRGFAYAAEGNVYFDVSKDPDYGRLSNRKSEQQESGLRDVEAAGKRNAADFALWKAAKAGEPSWDAPWGKGRPGWHIECSAMSMKYLGDTFDMHGGGMDLLFPHHENELAQSCCATGGAFVHYWMHNGLTRIRTKSRSGEWQNEKMSGSIGNVVSARELVDKYGAQMFRYFLLSTHYRRPIEFTDESLSNARKGLSTFERLFERIKRLSGQDLADDGQLHLEPLKGEGLQGASASFIQKVEGYRLKFIDMMDDDFNTAGAIAVMHELATEINSFMEQTGVEHSKESALIELVGRGAGVLRDLGRLIGLFVKVDAKVQDASADQGLVDGLMQLLIRLRNEARKAKNFALADEVRKALTELDITLEDRAGETLWRKGS